MSATYRLIVLAAEANDRTSQAVYAEQHDVSTDTSSHVIVGTFMAGMTEAACARTRAVFVDAIAYPDEGDHRIIARTSASVGHHSGTYGMAAAAIHSAMRLAEEGLAPRSEHSERFAL